MALELRTEEAELLKTLLLSELESKRVEQHHARNNDYKAELQKQERIIQGILKQLG